MRLLLDTNVLIWFATGRLKPDRESSRLLEDGTNEALVSAASAWEIATKFRIGKLPEGRALASDFEGLTAGRGLTPLTITAKHAQLAGSFAHEHGDPFDRMLAAQAVLEGAVLLSPDKQLDVFGVHRVW